jgi:hypothetical protein
MSDHASELHPLVDPFAGRVCAGCGCTEFEPCVDDEIGGACYWVEGISDANGPLDICSNCARIAAELVAAEDVDAPLVELASEHEADLFIRERRKAASA